MLNVSTLEVLFEDNHIMVVNKPAGVLTQSNGTDQKSLEDIAKAWVKKFYCKPGNVFLTPIHRLDKPASGIVLFAKTSKALSRLNESMRSHQMHKTYMALVEGTPIQSEATLENYLIHDDFQARIATEGEPEAKLARLHYRVIKKQQSHSLLEIHLETGRYHQIRCQLSAIGHPIVGDGRYGSRKPSEYIALLHCKFEFPHPITGALLTFETLPPAW